MMWTLGIFQGFGTMELVVIAVVALLIFGKRLPEVGRSLGRGIVEFKNGLKGIEDDIETASNERREERAAPKQLEAQEEENPYRATEKNRTEAGS